MLLNLLLLSSLLSGVLSKTVKPTDLDNYSFEQYLQDFRLNYSSDELPTRRKLFQQELTRVRQQNNKGSWKETLNRYSVMTKDEKSRYFGRHKNVANFERSLKTSPHNLPEDFKIRSVDDLPKHVDWRESGVVSVVKDQGQCGSCWAFASTATIESHVAIKTGLLFELSVQQMAMCAPNPDQCGGTGKCQGSTAELAFEYVSSSHGLFQEYQYGYESYYGVEYNCSTPPGATLPVATIKGYTYLPTNNYTVLMNAVATVGPIAINVDASTWHAYSSGVFAGCDQANPDVNHVVVLVGYGVDKDTKEKYWLVRNSWSASWGEAGYIRLARFDNDEERCGMDQTPQDGVACAGQTEPVRVCGTCGVIYDSSYPNNPVAY